MTPLIVRLLLDAQHEFLQLADAASQNANRPAGLNDPAWVIAHAAFFHDCWINGDAQAKPKADWEKWLVDWADRQRDARPGAITTDLGDAQTALRRVVPKATEFLSELTDASLETVPDYEEGAWPPGTTVGYLVARDIAHLFAHASELNVIATAAGRPDAGLPGRLSATASRT